MATHNPTMNNPVQFNFFGYRIVDNNTNATADNVTASFKYRGYEIAMTSFNKAGSKAIVLMNHVLVDEFGTVEAAIAAVNEWMEWQAATRPVREALRRGAGAGWRRA